MCYLLGVHGAIGGCCTAAVVDFDDEDDEAPVLSGKDLA